MKNRLNNLNNPVVIESHKNVNKMSTDQQQYLTLRILEILNKQSSTLDIMREVILEIKGEAGIEAVGIRLKDGVDYPYYETSGFSECFIKAEMNLCAFDENNNIILDSNDNPCLECMCGNVISGKTNPYLSFYTNGGSFWTNGTTQLIRSISGNDFQTHIRNRCNKEGYESVALIPLKAGDEIIGLLQLNDHRQNMFTKDYIQFLEKLGNSVGVAMVRRQTEEKLLESENKLLEAQKIAQLGYYVFDIATGFWTSSDELDTILGIDSSYTKDVSSWLNILHPDYREMMSNYLLNDILRKNNKFDKEYKIVDVTTGQEKWVHGLGNLKYDEKGNLIEMFGTIQDISESKQSKKALHDSNIAFKEILKSIEEEKKDQMLSVQAHVNRTVLPLVRKLEIGASELQSNYISLIIDNLETVVSPFIGKLESRFVKLSPREVEICKMLRDGMSSKEIAETLNSSVGTVFNQRKTIRKKLNIKKDKVNLVSFLKSI